MSSYPEAKDGKVMVSDLLDENGAKPPTAERRRTGRRTGQNDLRDDSNEVHEAKGLAPEVDGPARAEDEGDGGNDKWDDEVEDAVR